eukprot:TRINITY_DN40535_c0_g1_i1.p1 TRINITY_DN40535_c0_g1~~TRINITY_DN40535_c0_g1_i1.p1  ORF type:complete len:386 (-),score=58.11 TRINITY_DN40535_c0_g1_i1:38-1195(-)
MSERLAILALMLTAIARQAGAQCGPNGDKPYPPGQSSCPSMADGMAPHNRGGGTAPGGTAPGGTAGGTSAGTSSCSDPPCPASLLGDVALTTVTGTDSRSGITFQAGENIYGPFEAGFSSQQDSILEGLGCSQGSLGHVAGGIDTNTAEQMVAQQCSITLPREEGNSYISLLDECGGHTREYHFHEKLSCLYELSGSHSTQVGQASDGQFVYGKWEDFSASELPKLDACGGHFGITPDSNGVRLYHYHVQDNPPFTIGCYGPKKDSTGNYKLVTLAECRSIYTGCGNGDTTTVQTKTGAKQYDPWCPCYDAAGSNVGTVEHAVFSDTAATTCSGDSCSSFTSVVSSGAPGGAPPQTSVSGSQGLVIPCALVVRLLLQTLLGSVLA